MQLKTNFMISFVFLSILLSCGCNPEEEEITYPSKYVVANSVQFSSLQGFVVGAGNTLVPYSNPASELVSEAQDLQADAKDIPLEFLSFDRFLLKSANEIELSSEIPVTDFFGLNIVFPYVTVGNILKIDVQGSGPLELIKADNEKFLNRKIYVIRKQLGVPNNNFLFGYISDHTRDNLQQALVDLITKENYMQGDTVFASTLSYDYVKQ
jgi:hypothetical protein